MLNHKTVLVFGVNGDVASHICLRLALEGYRIVGVEDNPAKVKRVAREVEDVGSAFLPLIVDLTRTTWKAAFQPLADQLRDVTLVINVPAGETLYTTFLAEYEQHDDMWKMLPNLERIVDVNLERANSGARWAEIRRSVPLIPIFAANVDRTIDLAQVELKRRLAEGGFQQFSPVLVANEILCLLAQKDYQQVSAIEFRVSQRNVNVCLYGFNANGTPDYGRPIKQTRRSSILKTFLRETRHGKGVFAAQDFHRGDLILETAGVVLHHQTEHSMQIGWDVHLEPDPPIRFINHSCDPNAGVKTNKHGFPDIVALGDIKRGEEIFFDYAMTEFQHYHRDNVQMEFNLECRCGSPNCRGKLGYYSELPDELKEQYRGYLSDYLVEWDQHRAYHSASARSGLA
jgi:uncharacterized protein